MKSVSTAERRGEELEPDVARDLDVAGERRRREHEHVVARLVRALVVGPGRRRRRRSTAGRRSCAPGWRGRTRTRPAARVRGASMAKRAVPGRRVRRLRASAGSTAWSARAPSGNSFSSRQRFSPMTKSRTGAPRRVLVGLALEGVGRTTRGRSRPCRGRRPCRRPRRRSCPRPTWARGTRARAAGAGRRAPRASPPSRGGRDSSRSSPSGRGRASPRRAGAFTPISPKWSFTFTARQ